MDPDVYEIARDNGLEHSDAEEIEEIMDDWGVDAEEAYELWEEGV